MNAPAPMTWARWQVMNSAERAKHVDLSGLNPQLVGLEGWRVEVVSEMTGEKRRFIVGRSTGWRPCHLALPQARSRAGSPADGRFVYVTKIRKVR